MSKTEIEIMTKCECDVALMQAQIEGRRLEEEATRAMLRVKSEMETKRIIDEAKAKKATLLTEDDVRKVIDLFDESSDYYNKKIEEERKQNIKDGGGGGSRLAVGLWNGSIDARELSIQYILDKLGIKKEEQ